MLEEITVRDFALIDRIQVGFSAGLNLLTGETGAGKSIIVGALGAVLGEKLDASSIRTGCEETMVSAVVSVKKGTPSSAWLAEREFRIYPEYSGIEGGPSNLYRHARGPARPA
jgi:DNA repair protein RecN (Recombination protein N)